MIFARGLILNYCVTHYQVSFCIVPAHTSRKDTIFTFSNVCLSVYKGGFKSEQVWTGPFGGGGGYYVGGLHAVGGGCSTSIDWQAFVFYLLVADERKCYLDVSFKNCANGIADFWSVGGIAFIRFVTFTTVSFYSRGFKHNFPIIKSTTLPLNTLLPYNGEHIKQFHNLHSIQKVRMTHIIKLSPLTWPSVVIFGHRHFFCGEAMFSVVSVILSSCLFTECVPMWPYMDVFKLIHLVTSLAPYPHGNPAPTFPRHVHSFWRPPPDLFKHVHLGKRKVELKALLD